MEELKLRIKYLSNSEHLNRFFNAHVNMKIILNGIQGNDDAEKAQALMEIADSFDEQKLSTASFNFFLQLLPVSKPVICIKLIDHMLKRKWTNVESDALKLLPPDVVANELIAYEASNHVDLQAFFDQIKYQGFDRELTLKTIFRTLSPGCIVKLSLLLAMKGTNLAVIGDVRVEENLTVNNLLKSGLIKDDASRPENLTLSRIGSVTPHIALKAMFDLEKKNPIAKRFDGLKIPAFMQFPSVVGLKIRDEFKPLFELMSHYFSSSFNAKINVQLLRTIMGNAMEIPASRSFDDIRALKYFNKAVLLTEEDKKDIADAQEKLNDIESIVAVNKLESALKITDQAKKIEALSTALIPASKKGRN
jgi:hypothetical protein